MDKKVPRLLVYQLLSKDFPTDVSRAYRRGAFKDWQRQIAEVLKEVDPHNLTGTIDHLYGKASDLTGLDDQPQPEGVKDD